MSGVQDYPSASNPLLGNVAQVQDRELLGREQSHHARRSPGADAIEVIGEAAYGTAEQAVARRGQAHILTQLLFLGAGIRSTRSFILRGGVLPAFLTRPAAGPREALRMGARRYFM